LCVSDGQFFKIRMPRVDQVVEFFSDDCAGHLVQDGFLVTI